MMTSVLKIFVMKVALVGERFINTIEIKMTFISISKSHDEKRETSIDTNSI